MRKATTSPPKNVPSGLKAERMICTLLERIGQVGCIGILMLSRDHIENLKFNPWVVLMVLSIAAYYYLWISNVVKGQAVWCNSIWLGVAVICLAVGHFANSWNSYRDMQY